MAESKRSGLIGVASMELSRYVAFEMALHAIIRPPSCTITWGIGNNIAHNYNQIIRKALEHGFEWVWFIDNDHVFEPDVLIRLLAHNKQVTCPLNIRRSVPYGTTLHDPIDKGLRQVSWEQLRGWEGLVDIGDLNVGSSGMVLRMEVLEAIGDPWFTNIESMPENLSFDLAFCEKVRKAGYHIYLDTDARVGHIGEIAAWPTRDENGKWAYQLRATL